MFSCFLQLWCTIVTHGIHASKRTRVTMVSISKCQIHTTTSSVITTADAFLCRVQRSWCTYWPFTIQTPTQINDEILQSVTCRKSHVTQHIPQLSCALTVITGCNKYHAASSLISFVFLYLLVNNNTTI